MLNRHKEIYKKAREISEHLHSKYLSELTPYGKIPIKPVAQRQS